jgi:hypothetical protein
VTSGKCWIKSGCNRCTGVSFEASGNDIVYTVSNRCEGPLSSFALSVEGLLEVTSPGNGAYENAAGKWVVSQRPGWVVFTDRNGETDPKNSLKNGRSAQFRVSYKNMHPRWIQTIVGVATDVFDQFVMPIGECLYPSTCPAPAGASYKFYCVADGDQWLLIPSPVPVAGAEVADANCQCPSAPPVTSSVPCSSLDCSTCQDADATAVETDALCAWDGTQCVPQAAVTSSVSVCATGQVPFTPVGCPQNCSGKGYCNETTGRCVCFNFKDRGMNCGSRNGVSSATAAAIAGGALAGIIIGSVVIAGVVFLVISYGGYKGYDLINTSDFSNSRAYENPGYVASGNEHTIPGSLRN